MAVVERKPEQEMEIYLYYELTTYPISLFKDGTMRTQNNKSKWKSCLSENVITSEGADCIKVADGGALLCCCNWIKKEKFTHISKKYVGNCLIEKFGAVAFNWYTYPTKDAAC